MKPVDDPPSVDEGQPARAVATNIDEILRLEERQRRELSLSDRLAGHISRFSGSMAYVWLHVVWFAGWIGLSLLGLGFDPFPFGLLTMIVSLEAIFLSTFVLISQNREAALTERRENIDLQVNLLAEQEITKVMTMLSAIQERLGIDNHADDELREMEQQTHVRSVASAMDRAERSANGARSKGAL